MTAFNIFSRSHGDYTSDVCLRPTGDHIGQIPSGSALLLCRAALKADRTHAAGGVISENLMHRDMVEPAKETEIRPFGRTNMNLIAEVK